MSTFEEFLTTAAAAFVLLLTLFIIIVIPALNKQNAINAYTINRQPKSEISRNSMAYNTLKMLIESERVQQKRSTAIPSDFSILEDLNYIRRSVVGAMRIYTPTSKGIEFARKFYT